MGVFVFVLWSHILHRLKSMLLSFFDPLQCIRGVLIKHFYQYWYTLLLIEPTLTLPEHTKMNTNEMFKNNNKSQTKRARRTERKNKCKVREKKMDFVCDLGFLTVWHSYKNCSIKMCSHFDCIQCECEFRKCRWTFVFAW